MKYVENPNSIDFEELQSKKFLTTNPYKNLKIENDRVKSLKWFYEDEPATSSEIGSSAYVDESQYLFMRTEAVNSSYFTLIDKPHNKSPPFQPCKKQDFEKQYGGDEKKLVREGDIFYPTGGYLGKIGICAEDRNAVYSSHFYKLRLKEKYRYYVFGMLKSQFGKEQTERWPGGSIQVLDTFQEEQLESLKIPLPKQENDDEVVSYISSLVKAVIRREKEIQKKYNSGISQIRSELESESKDDKVFSMPTFSDLMEEKRLDTQIYSENLQRYEDLIKNYKHGFLEPGEAWDVNRKSQLNGKWDVIRGQNLQESQVGRSVYSDEDKDSFYRLILSSNISRHMDVPEMEYLGNPLGLQTVEKGDIVFSLRGHMGSTLVYCEEDNRTITNIDNAQIRNEDADLTDSIALGFYLRYLVEDGIIEDIAATGSGAGSLALYHFGNIIVPDFPRQFKEELGNKYYNEASLDRLPTTVSEFEDLDEQLVRDLGIFQLREQIRDMKEVVSKEVESIVAGREVEIDYSFLE